MAPGDSISTFFLDRRNRTEVVAPSQPDLTPGEAALVAEACTKSSIVWLRATDSERHHLAWHVWHDDAIHVIYGVDEQMLPLMSGVVEVVARSKETGTALVTFLATAEVLPAQSPPWEAAADALAAARLNSLEPAAARERWAKGTLISRITPLHVLTSGNGGHDTPSGAVAPPGNPATTIGRKPWHLGGRSAGRRGARH